METLASTLRRWGVRRGIAVVPESPASHTRQQTSSATTKSWRASTFRPALRVYDIVLVLALFIALAASIAWTAWLTVLTVSPNATANYIMSTQRYDEGSFWLLQDSPASLMMFGVMGLVIVGIGYVFVAIKLLKWFVGAGRQTARRPVPANLAQIALTRVVGVAVAFTRLRSKRVLQSPLPAPQEVDPAHRAQAGPPSGLLMRSPRLLAAAFASVPSDTIEFIVKVADLAIQGMWLFQQVLETGCPPVFVALFAASIVANALLWTWSIATGGSRLNRMLIELMFDFLLVVAIPITVLWLALATLALDYTLFDINLAVYPAFSFQQSARIHADPVKMLTANHSIDTLRIVTVLDFFTRVGSNLALCRRFNSVVELLKARDGKNTKRLSHSSSASLQMAPTSDKIKRYAKILYMFLFAASVIMVATVATVQSQRACEPHPECAIHAHRWVGSIAVGDLYKCPCRILVDVDRAPKTYEEWLNPMDVTDKVAQLAAAGTLEGIQLVNRQMEVFPDELQRCAGSLKYLSLMHTQLTALPPWFKRLTKLEYMFIQGSPSFGNPGSRDLEYIPPDAFDDMSGLALIHIAAHPNLPALPSLQALSNLRTLTLVFMTSVQDLPGLEKLAHLERMVLMRLAKITELPDLSGLGKLRALHIFDSPVCCNGFITGTCDTSDSVCADSSCYSGSSESTTSTRRVLQRFGATICPHFVHPDSNSTQGNGPPPMTIFPQELMAVCNGTLYRECSPPDATSEAMCFNSLFMPIWCDSGGMAIEARRREIAAGVGATCDPAVEAWLGCQATR